MELLRTKIETLIPKLKSPQLWRYLLVGVSTFLIDFLVLIFLREVVGLPVLVAASISYWLSILFNFTLNRHWTFQVGQQNMSRQAYGYALLLAFNFFVTLLLIAAMTRLGLHYTIAKLIAVGLQTSWTYLAYKQFVFK